MQNWERFNTERAQVEQDMQYLSAAERASYNLPDPVAADTPPEELENRELALKGVKDAIASTVANAKRNFATYNTSRSELLKDLNELPPAQRRAFNVPDEAGPGTTDQELAARQLRIKELKPRIREQVETDVAERVQRAVDRGIIAPPRTEESRKEETPAATPAETGGAPLRVRRPPGDTGPYWTKGKIAFTIVAVILVAFCIYAAIVTSGNGKDDSKATAATAGDSGAKVDGSKEKSDSDDKTDPAKPETSPTPAAPDDAMPPETAAKTDDPVDAPGLPEQTVFYNKDSNKKLQLIRERAEANRRLTP